MSGKSASDYMAKYTKPKLRERLKEQIKASSKGGRKNQWSARKSQLLAKAYEKQGGDYRNRGRKSKSQKSLDEWTDQDWQTREGKGRARLGQTTRRYLPRKAWELLSDEEQRQTDRKKRRGSREGRQYIANSDEAKAARAYVDQDDPSGLTTDQLKKLSKSELYKLAKRYDVDGRSKMNKGDLAKAVQRAT